MSMRDPTERLLSENDSSAEAPTEAAELIISVVPTVVDWAEPIAWHDRPDDDELTAAAWLWIMLMPYQASKAEAE